MCGVNISEHNNPVNPVKMLSLRFSAPLREIMKILACPVKCSWGSYFTGVNPV